MSSVQHIIRECGKPNASSAVVAELLEGDASLARARGVCGETPLFSAALHGKAAICSLLLKVKANVDERTDRGWTALMAAGYGGHVDVCEVLVRSGANPWLWSSPPGDSLQSDLPKQHTALSAAVAMRNYEACAIIRKAQSQWRARCEAAINRDLGLLRGGERPILFHTIGHFARF